VQPHPTDNALIVRGSNEQVTQIKLLVTQLEPGEGGGYGGEGNLRTIPLGGRNPEDFLRALERVWNVRGRNPIRTVIPSATGAIRDRRVPSSTSPFNPEGPADAAPDRPQPVPSTPQSAEPAEKPDQSAGRVSYETPVAARLNATFLKSVPDDLAFAFTGDPFTKVSHSSVSQGDAAADDVNDAATNEELQQLFLDLNAAEAARDAASTDTDAPIAITIQGGNLMIVSEDEAALDRLEDVIASLAAAMPPKTQWTVFYLRSADATQTASILERLFPTSSVSTSVGASSDGGFMSELTGGLSAMGRGIVGMSGLDSVLSGPQTLRIIPDVRSNSLFVSGPPHQIDEVEDVLRILDASELPEQLRDRAPRYIAVKYAQVDEVAAILSDVFKEELTPPQRTQQQRGGGGGNPFAALMGGGGGAASAPKVQMTMGIDYQNSRLYVSSNEPTFLQVQAMVEEIDTAALEARRAIRVVPLEHASSTMIRQTIGSLLPRVKVSSSSTSSRSTSSGGSSNNSDSNRNNSQQQAAEQLRQQFIQRALQGGGGRPGGGGTGRPGGGGGGFPGSGGGRPGGSGRGR
jgi:hypothetical protein